MRLSPCLKAVPNERPPAWMGLGALWIGLGAAGGGVGLVACSDEVSFVRQVRTETFEQAATDQIDILFVVDDSPSMVTQQNLLAEGFDSFIAGLEDSGTDFQLGVIKIDFEYDDPTRGRLLGEPPILTPSDNYRRLFVERALVGLDGSGWEKGLEAATFATSPQSTGPGGPNEGFVREGANLLIVVVSDEDDCSDGGTFGYRFDQLDCYRRIDDLIPTEVWVERMQRVKRRPEQLRFSGIVGQFGAEGLCAQETLPGTRYIRAAQLTGGQTFDICTADWSGFLGELGVEASQPLRVFPLECGVSPGTLEVRVDDEVLSSDQVSFDPDARAVRFEQDAVPARGSSIEVSYEIEPGTCGPRG